MKIATFFVPVNIAIYVVSILPDVILLTTASDCTSLLESDCKCCSAYITYNNGIDTF